MNGVWEYLAHDGWDVTPDLLEERGDVHPLPPAAFQSLATAAKQMRFDRSAAWCHRRCFETRSGITRAGLTLRPAHEARLQTPLSKFSRATTPEELFTGQWQSRATELDAYKFCLDQRWQEGCTHAWRLWEEIREQGYPDGYVRTFAHMVTDLQGDQLPEWIESARASTTCQVSAGSPSTSNVTLTPLSATSPSRGTPVSSKAMSTGSRCSGARRSGVHDSYSYAKESSWRDWLQGGHMTATGRGRGGLVPRGG
ncbi:hypothetical protein [Streptomyces sp900105755]|uniref:Uncharacterized protein n=1 Tax=Streptomyces sp. 900105755 TaxID=3154389 RepID=A0ABV1TX68_9ACTN